MLVFYCFNAVVFSVKNYNTRVKIAIQCQIKSNMTLITVDGPQPAYNLLNM